jgi:hypothetical protein
MGTPIRTMPAYSAVGLHGQLVAVVPTCELVVAISSHPFPHRLRERGSF